MFQHFRMSYLKLYTFQNMTVLLCFCSNKCSLCEHKRLRAWTNILPTPNFWMAVSICMCNVYSTFKEWERCIWSPAAMFSIVHAPVCKLKKRRHQIPSYLCTHNRQWQVPPDSTMIYNSLHASHRICRNEQRQSHFIEVVRKSSHVDKHLASCKDLLVTI